MHSSVQTRTIFPAHIGSEASFEKGELFLKSTSLTSCVESDGVYSSAHHLWTRSTSYNQNAQPRWRRPSSTKLLNLVTGHGCCRMGIPSVFDAEETSDHSCCKTRTMATQLKMRSKSKSRRRKSHFSDPLARSGRSECHTRLAGTSTSHAQ